MTKDKQKKYIAPLADVLSVRVEAGFDATLESVSEGTDISGSEDDSNNQDDGRVRWN